ncbi:hypothetical protein AXW67_11805 [Bradyrhizobium neotropicale]|uniref:Uncharacterized protein n=1 Tax=Bradyrhizobium neotropicale TaxID=1497615 RepID=A0A176Z7W8_9BRAD|nr:hypothetical protein AXW67_11805 [Bradyrhizobium neotropicale]
MTSGDHNLVVRKAAQRRRLHELEVGDFGRQLLETALSVGDLGVEQVLTVVVECAALFRNSLPVADQVVKQIEYLRRDGDDVRPAMQLALAGVESVLSRRDSARCESPWTRAPTIRLWPRWKSQG